MSTTCSFDETEPDRKIGKATQKLAENKMVLVVLEDGVENYKNKFWDQHRTADDLVAHINHNAQLVICNTRK